MSPVSRDPGIEVRVFSGRSGNIEAIARVSQYVPVIMLDVRLDGSSGHDNDWTSFTQEIPAGDEGFVYVLSGQAYFSSKRTSVSAGQVCDFQVLALRSIDRKEQVTYESETCFHKKTEMH